MQKIVEKTLINEVPVSAAVLQWNYGDQEHATYVHDRYKRLEVLYENSEVAVKRLDYQLPFLPFLRSNSMMMELQVSPNISRCIDIGLFGIPIITQIEIEATSENTSRIITTHRFELNGWQVLLAPFLNRMIRRWNDQTQREDEPLRLRRQKVLRAGFVDFQGIPVDRKDRHRDGELHCKLPVPRVTASKHNRFLKDIPPKA